MILIAASVVAAVLARGAYDVYDRVALIRAPERAPGWTRPCRPTAPYVERYVHCARVRGRVVWIQRQDPDGDGDRHLIVVSRLHPRIVKLDRALGVAHLPRVGAQVEAVGWLSVGGSGRPEVDSVYYASGGTVRRRPG